VATEGIECLRCGAVRSLEARARRRLDGGECPRCGYVGWALSRELNDRQRQALRDRPLFSRRLRLAG
jgi:Zn ribbon nucleic-acid-binding protein